MPFDGLGAGRGGNRGRGGGVVVRGLRALSGAVAAGVVVVMLFVVGAAYLSGDRGFPGPGRTSLVVHGVAALAVVVGQRFADRTRGMAAASASVAIFVIAGLVLWSQWWG